MKNALIRFICAITAPFIAKNNGAPRYLIVSTTALGDTLWATPALRALRKSKPTAFIALLTGAAGKELLHDSPYIDALYAINNAPIKRLVSLWKQLKKQRLTHIFVLHASQRSLFPLLHLLGAQHTVAFTHQNKGLDMLFSRLVAKGAEHEIESRLRMLAIYGIAPDGFAMESFPSKAKAPRQRLIALCPGAKDSFRRWPASHFTALGQKLAEAYPDYAIYIVGNAAERPLLQRIAEGIPQAIVQSNYTLDELHNVLQTCRLCITNDSGPMHLAYTAKTPTITLFAPSSPTRFGPLDVPNAQIIQRAQSCTPCLKRQCLDNFCMRQITPETVYQTAKQWL